MRQFYVSFRTNVFTLKRYACWLTTFFLAVLYTASLNAQNYQPITVSGFNHDLVANGNASPLASTTSATDIQGTVLYEKGYSYCYPTISLQYGLPSNRVINSASNTGVTYNLASYTGNNALFLVNYGEVGSLTFASSGSYSRIAILAASSEGSSSFNARLDFTDGSTTNYSFSVPDWYFGGNYAIAGTGRMSRNNCSTDESAGNPRLYDNLITLTTADKAKLLKSITFSKTSSGGRTFVFAVTGVTAVDVPSAPTNVTTTNITSSGFTANWSSVTNATSYNLDVSTDPNFVTLVPGYNNLSVGNATTYNVTNVSAGTYYVRVRAVNSNGQSISSVSASATIAAQVAAGALNFDGVNDQVSIGTLLNIGSSYTKEAWVNATTQSGINVLGSLNNPFWINLNGKLAAGNGGNGASYSLVEDPNTFPLNVWTHVAVTYDAATNTMKLYKNGNLVATNTSIPTYTGGEMVIGSHYLDATTFMWKGAIEEVRVWDRALCAGEIQNNKSGELSLPQKGLLAYYKMNQGIVGADNSLINTLIDGSGNNNNGTLKNFALTGATSNWVAGTVSGTAPTFAAPTVVASSNSPVTFGKTLNLNADGSSGTYAWTGPNNHSFSIQNPSVNSVQLADGGVYTVTRTVNGCTASASTTVVVGKADQTITFTTLSDKTYGDAAFNLTATASSNLPVTYTLINGNATLNGKTLTITGAGPVTIKASQAGDGNYNAATDVQQSFTVNKANALVNVNGFSGPYDGNAHGATGTAKGVNNVDLSGLLHFDNGFTDAPGGTVNWTFDGNENYNSVQGSTSIAISKVDASIRVDGFVGTYDGSSHSANGSAKGINGEELSSLLNVGDTYTNVPGGTVNWSFLGNANYNSASGTVAVTISKAPATISFGNLVFTYDGVQKQASATTVPAGLTGLTVSGSGTNAGDYSASASLDNVNYDASPITGTLHIDKANATVVVNGYTGVYDAAAHGATGTAKGVNGEELSGLQLGETFTNVPGGNANWTFTDATGNYNNIDGSSRIQIGKATATIIFGNLSFVYNGSQKSATATTVPANLNGLTVTGAGTNAGDYTASASLDNINYEAVPLSGMLHIAKATASISVAPYSVAYDGASHTATGTATGAAGEDLSALLTVGGTTHTNAGNYNNDAWSFTGNNNYEPANGIVTDEIKKAKATLSFGNLSFVYDGTQKMVTASTNPANLNGITVSGNGINAGTYPATASLNNDNYEADAISGDLVINKAKASVNVSGYNVAYDGTLHRAVGTATGAHGENLNGLLNLSQTEHTAAGTYNADAWSFAGDGNHEAANGSVDNQIKKALATIVVNGYTGTYDAAAHGATGTAKGVNNETLSGLNLGQSFTDAPGGVANWTFTNPNYSDQNGSVTITLDKANQTITWSNPSSVTCGTALNGSQLNATVAGISGGSAPGSLVYTPAAGTVLLNNPSYELSVTAAATQNYKEATKKVQVNVTKVAPPTISVSRTDNTFTGGDASTIFLGYGAQKLTLTAAGGTTYKWINNTTGLSTTTQSSTVFAPTAAGNYTFTVEATNSVGCTAQASVTITVADVRCGNDKVNICHLPDGNLLHEQTLCISTSAVAAHLAKGCKLGQCVAGSVTMSTVSNPSTQSPFKALTINVAPNPTTSHFRMSIESSNLTDKVTVRVIDVKGRLLEVRNNAGVNTVIELGDNYASGMYIVEVTQGSERRQLKLIKVAE